MVIWWGLCRGIVIAGTLVYTREIRMRIRIGHCTIVFAVTILIKSDYSDVVFEDDCSDLYLNVHITSVNELL